MRNSAKAFERQSISRELSQYTERVIDVARNSQASLKYKLFKNFSKNPLLLRKDECASILWRYDANKKFKNIHENYMFCPGQDLIHHQKHHNGLRKTFGYDSYTLEDYVGDANFVIKNGTYVSELNAYIAVAGGKGKAKVAFVGLNRNTNEITTFHLKTVAELEKLAPSLWVVH